MIPLKPVIYAVSISVIEPQKPGMSHFFPSWLLDNFSEAIIHMAQLLAWLTEGLGKGR